MIQLEFDNFPIITGFNFSLKLEYPQLSFSSSLFHPLLA